MSSSQHPIALAIEQRVGGATRLLATVMCLPLVDGLFPALVLAGAIDGPLGILEVGLLVFGGSATVAVILADMEGGPRKQVPAILGVGLVLVSAAAVEAALAPTIRNVLNLWVFQRFAALVILAVAAKTASARIGELFPRPAVIVLLGLLASVDPAGATLSVSTDLSLVARGAAAGLAGVLFALAVSLAGPSLRAYVDLDRFRFGSAVALGMLPLSMFGLIPEDAPLALAVLGVTSLLAFDPDAGEEPTAEPEPDPQSHPEAAPRARPNVEDSPMGAGGANYRHNGDVSEQGSNITGDPGLARNDDESHAPWL